MPTYHRRLAESRQPSRRFRVIAGRPASFPAPKPEAPAVNPWFDAASDERLLAAAFADRVVLVACLVIGVLLLADLAAPDLAAWLSGHSTVLVSR